MKSAAINVIGTVFLTTAVIFAGSAIADDPGASPIGNWMCLAAGAPKLTGQLIMTETAYEFARPGAQVSSHGSYRIDRNVIIVTGGPLKDDFGLHYGHFSTKGSPPALTFDTDAGRGMTCNPDP